MFVYQSITKNLQARVFQTGVRVNDFIKPIDPISVSLVTTAYCIERTLRNPLDPLQPRNPNGNQSRVEARKRHKTETSG